MNRFKVSTLIFCKDNLENLIDLIKNVYPISDEIVIVDSSIPTNKKLLLKKKDLLNLKKVFIYPVVALGHPEPYQMYGLSKCKYSWIFYIDTDERLDDVFKKNMHLVIKNSKYNAFLVRKKEFNKENKRLFDSYQRRLYKKNSAIYRGDIFSDPIIKGKEIKLNKHNFLTHHFEYYDNPAKSYNRYFIFCAYELRKSYRDLLEMANDRPLVRIFLNLYYKIKNIELDYELTKFDYKFLQMSILYITGEIVYNLKNGTFPNIGFIFNNYKYVMKEIDSFFSYPLEKRLVQLKIAHEIRLAGGVINYLRVDKAFIKNLLLKYDSDNLNGVQLFISLLEKEYKNRAQWDIP